MFACTRKERQITRAGTPFLTLELRDSTGSIRRRARSATPTCSRGASSAASWCACAGRAARFREQLQIDIADDRARRGRGGRPGALPADRLPRPRRAGGLPRAPRARGLRPGAAALLDGLLGDARAARAAAPRAVLAARPRPGGAAGRSHHAYLGGLLEHTVAVATLAIELCTMHPRLDRDLLLSAAIVHDLGKTREFTYGAEIARSPEGACSDTSSSACA